MRTLMALAAVVMVTAATASAADRCGGRYDGYTDWAQQAFCKPQSG